MRILIADDNEDLRMLLSLLVESHDPGWTVAGVAGNGREAVEVARAIAPDVVLLDLSMPVMDGLEALPLLRDAAPDATLVMLSAFPTQVMLDAASARGADGYLDKGEVARGLIAGVEAIVAQRQSRSA